MMYNHVGRWGGIALLALFFPLLEMRGQGGDSTVPCKPSLIESVGVTVSTLAVHVVLHELGHYAVAHAIGARRAEIDFFALDENPLALAVTRVDTFGLNSADIAAISLAGVGTTRLMAEGADLLSDLYDDDTDCPGFARRTLSTMYITGRFDFPAYTLQDGVLNLLGKEGSDIDHFVTAVAGEKTLPRVLTYGGLLAVSAVDIWLDWERIQYHIDIAEGRRPPAPKEDASMGWRWRPVVAPEYVGVQVAARW